MQSHSQKRGFTLIELLVVIAIIAILAAILFPVFQGVRENARRITCTSNMKQFALGIIMYANDNDEGLMPGSIDSWCVGPGTVRVMTAAGVSGVFERGPHIFLSPYVKDHGIYTCPDDSAIGQNYNVSGSKSNNTPNPGYDKTGAANECPGTLGCVVETYPGLQNLSFSDAYGHSYKFTKENYSIIPTGPVPALTVASATSSSTINCYNGVQLTMKKDLLLPLGLQDGVDSLGNPKFKTTVGIAVPVMPPPIMTLSFFAQPANTKIMRDQDCGWEGPIYPKGQHVWHPAGGNWGFEDGHVKFLNYTDKLSPNPVTGDLTEGNRFCDGPTGAPFGGSAEPCNSKSLVRVAP